MLVILALVIAPAGILFYYFWVRDRWEHEPPSMIWKLFGLGCLSIIPAVILDIIIFGLETTPETIADVFMFSFIAAGLIEETSKFWFVYFYTRRSRYFSEEYDGIMYAVAVGLGFAFAENILYVVSALMQDSSGLSIAILRAFTAVPAHALDGVILGYFIGRSHFEKSFARKVSLNLTGLLLAVAFHGLYDFFAFLTIVLPPNLAGWCIVGLIWIIIVQWATVYRFIRSAQIASRKRWILLKASADVQPIPSESQSKRFCASCGNPINPGVNFCPNCGGGIR
jgi:RsiW-degrading membrane proteinase PrsW (M82 family)